jgi:hypothetical protein
MSKLQRWEYCTEGNYASGAIVNVENGEIVLYRDDISVDTIVEIVALYNSGSNTKDIEKFLKEDTRITDDEADAVLEQIELYLKLSTQPLKDVVSEPFVGDVLEPKDPEAETLKSDIIKLAAENKDKPDEKPKRVINRTPKSPTATGSKKVSAEDAIEKLKVQQAQIQEKMILIQIAQELALPEAPAEMSKHVRDLWLNFSKKYDNLIGEFITEIQIM